MAFFNPSANAVRFNGSTAQQNVQDIKDFCTNLGAKLKCLALYVATEEPNADTYVAALIDYEQTTGGVLGNAYKVLDSPYLTKKDVIEIAELLRFAENLSAAKWTPPPPGIIFCRHIVSSTQSKSEIEAARELADYIKNGPAYSLDKSGFKALL